MCKNPSAVICDAKRDTPEVYALYKNDSELVGICKVFSESLAIAYNILPNDELDYYNKDATKRWTNMYEFVRYLFHVEGGPSIDEKLIRDSYTVAAC